MGLLGNLLDEITYRSSKGPSKMSDRELQRKLNKGVGKNTGESLAQCAAYIKEGQSRGITANQKKK